MFKFTSDSLRWEGKEETFRLYSADELLLELKYQQRSIRECKINDRRYAFVRTGFWNPVYSILEKGQPLLRMQHQFWGSKGIIRSGEEEMELTYLNEHYLNLLITKGSEKVLRFALSLERSTPPFKLELGTAVLEVDILLLLIALCFVLTKDIVAEYHGAQDGMTMQLLMGDQ